MRTILTRIHGEQHCLMSRVLLGTFINYFLTEIRAVYFFYLLQFRKILRSSGQYKYLHSAVIISGLMLVFGGNTHNDTSMSYGAKCYSSDFLAYDMGLFSVYILVLIFVLRLIIVKYFRRCLFFSNVHLFCRR